MKSISIFLFIILFAHESPSQASRDSALESLVASGDSAFVRCDNVRALEIFEKGVAIDSSSYALLLRVARTRNDNGRLLLRINRDSSEAWYESALPVAERLRRLFPDSAEANLLLALCKGSLIPFHGIIDKIHLGKEARELAEVAIGKDSGCVGAYVVLGIFSRQAWRLSWLEKTLAKTFFGADFHGTLEESEYWLNRAATREPSNVFAHFELAWVYRDWKKPELEERELRIVTSRLPRSARERQLIGDAKAFLDRLAQK